MHKGNEAVVKKAKSNDNKAHVNTIIAHRLARAAHDLEYLSQDPHSREMQDNSEESLDALTTVVFAMDPDKKADRSNDPPTRTGPERFLGRQLWVS